MEDQVMPYFMENEEWYYYDEEAEIYRLTDKATEEAKESYRQFYEEYDTI